MLALRRDRIAGEAPGRGRRRIIQVLGQVIAFVQESSRMSRFARTPPYSRPTKRGSPKPPEGSKLVEIPVQLPVDLVDRHRSFTCASYDTCLTHAGAKNWQSFSCQTCPLRPALAPEDDVDMAAVTRTRAYCEPTW
jgi:hypothetical protein